MVDSEVLQRPVEAGNRSATNHARTIYPRFAEAGGAWTGAGMIVAAQFALNRQAPARFRTMSNSMGWTDIEIESYSLLMRYREMLRGGNVVDQAAAKELARQLADCSARADAGQLHYMVSRLNDAVDVLDRRFSTT